MGAAATLAERLREARESAGLSRRALSLAAELAPSTVGQIESGKIRNPSYEATRKIAALLKVDVEWLGSGASPVQIERKSETSKSRRKKTPRPLRRVMPLPAKPSSKRLRVAPLRKAAEA